jgi:putative ABC transport system ATP-binding protein
MALAHERPEDRAVLRELGLTDRGNSYPEELSGGERQRVAIARAVVGERHLVFADEPSGALDSENGEVVMRLIVAACERGAAAVVVIHDSQDASRADRVGSLQDGCMVKGAVPAAGATSYGCP